MSESVVNYSILVPDRYQEILIDLGSRSTSISFSIGDVTNDIRAGWQSVKRERPDLAVSDADINAAVGAFCGKSARTVREYAAVAAFYTLEIREVYAVLSFDHFRTAMTLGPRWEMALMWAIDESQTNGGRPATVDKMVAKFAVPADMPDENPDPIEPVGPQNAAESVLGRNLAEAKIVADFVTNVSKLRAILQSTGLSRENSTRAEALLSELLEILSDLKI